MRRAAVVAAAVLALLVFAPVARACSCAQGDARSSLSAADGAFVGTVVAGPSEPVNGPHGWTEVSWEFSVERSVKGDLRERVTVWSSSDGASCGLEVRQGQRLGLFLYRQGERWMSGLCSTADPDELIAAAAPLPAPDGTGPPAFVAGGELGDTRLVALDGRGRTLAYGKGDGGWAGMSVCPGGSRVATLSSSAPGRAVATLYELPSLRVLRNRDVMQDEESSPRAVGCGDSEGNDMFVFYERFSDPAAQLTLYRVRGDEPVVPVWIGPGSAPVFDPRGRFAIVAVREPASLTIVTLPDGQARQLAALRQAVDSLAVHPGGQSVAALGQTDTTFSSWLSVMAMDGSVLAERRLGSSASGPLLWSGDNRLTLTTFKEMVETFDARLKPLAKWDGQLGWAAVARDGLIYTLGADGRMSVGSPMSGRLAPFRQFPGTGLRSLAALPSPKRTAPTSTTATSTAAPPPEATTTTWAAPEPRTDGGLVAAPASSSRNDDGGGVPGPLGAFAVAALVLTVLGTLSAGYRRFGAQKR